MLVNNQVQIQRRGDKTDEPKQTGLRQLEIVTKKGCDKQNKTDFMCRFELLFFFFTSMEAQTSKIAFVSIPW